ncbi:MAG: hypothetical protein ABEH88_08150 [Halobacteriales archaeon]
MEARSRRVFVAALAFLVVGGVMMPVVLADSHEYRISVDGSVPIPEQTKEIDRSGVEGKFIFNAIKGVAPGEQFKAEVNGVPGGDSYRLRLEEFVDGDTPRIRSVDNMNGNGQATFTAPEDPGLYFLSAYTSTYESLYPIIVQKYSVTVDWGEVPSEAESGSEIDVHANITLATTRGKQSLGRGDVDVVIANEETLYNETISYDNKESEPPKYLIFNGKIRINGNSLPPGDDYSVYVAARGPEKLEGLRVPVGISEQQAFEVTEPSTPASTPSPTPTPTPSPTSTPTPSPTTTATPSTTSASNLSSTTTSTLPSTTVPVDSTSTETTASPETQTRTDNTGTLPDTLPTLQPTTGTLKPPDESTPTETEGGILTPGVAETESPGEQTTTDGQLGFTAITAVLVILFGAALLRRL